MQRQLKQGVSLLEYQQARLRFLGEVSRLQVRLSGKNPELMTILDTAADSLVTAEDSWKKELECDAIARQRWCVNCSHQQMYAFLERSVADWPDALQEYKPLIDSVHESWTRAAESRQEEWRNFAGLCESASALMGSPKE